MVTAPTARAAAPMSFAAFQRWNAPDDRRYELIDGVPVAMASPSLRHQVLAGNLFLILDRHLRAAHRPCRVVQAHGIHRPAERRWAGDSYRVPDVSVLCGETRAAARMPILVVEVSSESEDDKYQRIKRRFYNSIGSIQEFLVIGQDEPEGTLYRRQGDLLQIVADPVGGDARVRLESVGLDLAFAELYADLPEPDMTDGGTEPPPITPGGG